MKILWKSELDIVKTAPSYFLGAFVHEDQTLNYYFFSSIMEISDISLNIENGALLHIQKNGTDAIQENVRQYSTRKLPEHYCFDDFIFDNYRIAHHGEWGYVCFKNQKPIWKKSLKGYLYTDIIKNNNHIVFGTSGYGGHFYAIDIDTGEIIFDFNTKGTSSFFCANDSYYFCSKEKKTTKLYRIDFEGRILDMIEIDGVYHDYACPMMLKDNRFCVVTLVEKKKDVFVPIITCVALQ